MHFCDETNIFVSAGEGGKGCVSFRREKYVPLGGPDGGNGGHGGSVILEASENINTLSSYLGKKHYKAEKGEMGYGQNKAGRHGEHLTLLVPVGTLVYNRSTGERRADLTEHGQKVVMARGGIGGKGNAGFVSSVRQAPDFAEIGEPGEALELQLELKMIADVALIGYPSVGKSTLISRISNAKPKIADYPFTTLVPNLGTVKVDETDFLVADIPGLIEGAHKGKGLGDEFLKHIERTTVLVHLLDATRDDLLSDYKKINRELKLFSLTLAKKPQLLVVNKVDATIPEIIEQAQKQFIKQKPLFISAVSGEGLDRFLYTLKDFMVQNRLKARLANHDSEGAAGPRETQKVFRPHLDLPNARQFEIEKTDAGFRVVSKRIEQMAIMTDMTKRGAVLRMLDVFKKVGIHKELLKLGAEDGDKILIRDRVFEFVA